MHPNEKGFCPPERTEFVHRTKKWLRANTDWRHYRTIGIPVGLSPRSLAVYGSSRPPVWYCHYLAALALGFQPFPFPEGMGDRDAFLHYTANAPDGWAEAIGISDLPDYAFDERSRRSTEIVHTPWLNAIDGERSRYSRRHATMAKACAEGFAPCAAHDFGAWER